MLLEASLYHLSTYASCIKKIYVTKNSMITVKKLRLRGNQLVAPCITVDRMVDFT